MSVAGICLVFRFCFSLCKPNPLVLYSYRFSLTSPLSPPAGSLSTASPCAQSCAWACSAPLSRAAGRGARLRRWPRPSRSRRTASTAPSASSWATSSPPGHLRTSSSTATSRSPATGGPPAPGPPPAASATKRAAPPWPYTRWPSPPTSRAAASGSSS